MGEAITDNALSDAFRARFGRAATVEALAHGRVNLIGEHTDYNGGYVLPAPIPQRTRVLLAPRADQRVRVWSAAFAAEPPADYTLGAEKPGRGWLDYVQGVTVALGEAGYALGGFDAAIASDIPVGAGLSSSAALCVALLRALRRAFALALDDVPLALAAQAAETGFVGAQIGLMDQLSTSLGEPGAALFIDTHSLAYHLVPLPAAAQLAVVDSGVRHAHATGDYNTRRAECERAAALLGVTQLRDVAADDARLAALPKTLRRRARHVIGENARVLAAVDALSAGDVARLGALFFASHTSQRDDYDVSTPELDRLVALAGRDPDIYGARLTGGGWGGAVLLLTRAGAGLAAAQRLAAAYTAETGAALPSPFAL